MNNKFLRGITWEHPRGFDSVNSTSPLYKAIVPEVTIEWEYRSLQAFADRSIEELAVDFDLLVIDHPHIPLAAESGIFAPFADSRLAPELDVLKKQSVGRSFESYVHQGQIWALPIDAAAQVSASRISELTHHPESWDEVLELAKEGRVAWPLKPIDAYSSFITLATNMGYPPMRSPGEFLQKDQILEVIDFMLNLVQYVPRSNFAMNPIEVADLLSSDSPWIFSPLLFGYTNYSRFGFRKHLLRYRNIPVGKQGLAGSLLGGAGIAVSSRSTSIPEAQEFALWLASANTQKTIYFDAGGQPGNSVAWEDPRLNQLTQDFFSGTRDTLEQSYLRPRDPRYIAVQDQVSVLVTQTLIGELQSSDFAQRANQICEGLLGG